MGRVSEALQVVYSHPQQLQEKEAKELFFLAQHSSCATLRGEAWLAVGIVQNLHSSGVTFSSLPSVDCCFYQAYHLGLTEARDFLHELRLDTHFLDDYYSNSYDRDPDVKLRREEELFFYSLSPDVGRFRLRLESLLESGDCYAAADYLYELNKDSIPDVWTPQNHLEFPKECRRRIYLWLLIAHRIGLLRDLRLLICKEIAK